LNKRKIIIFKNDATGDLIHAREAIYNLIHSNKDKEIIIYLSNQSKQFSFLFRAKNLKFKFINKNLSLSEKIKIFYLFFDKSIDETYIFTPKVFFFYLPLFFRKIRFYGICVDDINNYKRPNFFLRKFLFKKVINERKKNFKRPSIFELQNNLIGEYHKSNYKLKFDTINHDKRLANINDYFHFHINQIKFSKLGWTFKDVDTILTELQKYKEKIIITRDIEKENRKVEYHERYNVFDFKNKNYIDNNSNITLLENVEGIDLYQIIRNAKKIIAFHGMITSFAWIEKKSVLDLFFCEIENWNDYRRYRNSFYEFKPIYKDYDFIIPKKDVKKTLNKMTFFLNK
tara:strand:- start:1170 stop:2198 length:1029 start_codon:yes stop_codon:yes gene_type:complete